MARKLEPREQPWCVDEEGKPVINKGVQNVCIDKSKISFIDGFHSKLYYRGYTIEDIAKNTTFEETTYLLIYGELPTKRQLEDFKGWLREERDLPEEIVDLLYKLPRDTEPTETLRTAVSYLGNLDPGRHDLSRQSMYRKAIRLIAKMPTIVAYFYRIINDKDIVPPDPRFDHAENFLYMFHGKRPSKLHAECMDLSLKLYAVHGMNASTFAAVVIASTLSDYYSAIVGGIGALRGPLHGYANVLAIKQFEEIGSVDNVEKWFKENIESGKRRLMGFGHRVYKSYDPRARIYREYGKKLAEEVGGDVKRIYDIAFKLEEIALKSKLAKKGIFTNTDFWSGLVYMALGIPVDFYCTLFAISRVVGWTAYILEYTENNRIIRPRVYYDGEVDKEFIPIDKRG